MSHKSNFKIIILMVITVFHTAKYVKCGRNHNLSPDDPGTIQLTNIVNACEGQLFNTYKYSGDLERDHYNSDLPLNTPFIKQRYLGFLKFAKSDQVTASQRVKVANYVKLYCSIIDPLFECLFSGDILMDLMYNQYIDLIFTFSGTLNDLVRKYQQFNNTCQVPKTRNDPKKNSEIKMFNKINIYRFALSKGLKK